MEKILQYKTISERKTRGNGGGGSGERSGVRSSLERGGEGKTMS